MKFKILVPSTLRLANEEPAFKPKWYYGFSYKPVDQFAEVYHLRPFNLWFRFWYWFLTAWWTLVFKILFFIARMVERRRYAKTKTKA